jgi:hypothetical protein
MGHGQNRVKLTSHFLVHQAHEAICWQCGMIDSQQHLILQCKHAPLIATRANARTKQRDIARNLMKDHAKSRNLQHFIKQCIDRRWSSNTAELTRLWLGNWTASTLTDILKQSPTTHMKMSNREIYIKTARKLTEPLIDAYYLMPEDFVAASPTSKAQKNQLSLLDISPLTITPPLMHYTHHTH